MKPFANRRLKRQQDYEKRLKELPAGDPPPSPPDLNVDRDTLPHCFAFLARRTGK